FYVFQETKKLHLPAELALLPMIESDYLPRGSSDVGAAGLWQLMPGLASDYGVKMNYFYDGRRSTTVSTRVALHFLSYLYQMFNHNWLLALAAYDAGPGTVMAAIHHNERHGLPTDFWALSLPKETEAYIPKLLALATIIQHPHAYGIRLAPVPNEASTVTINKQMKLKTIANLAHTTVNTVQKLNPALKRSKTPPGQTLTLVLPANNKTTFVKHLKARKEIQQAIKAKNYAHYKVQHGDSLGKIASRFKTDIASLERINQLHDGSIRINQALLVPRVAPETHQKISTHASAKTEMHKKQLHAAKNGKAHLYTVRSGDDLKKIAARYHTTAKHLMAINHMSRSLLNIGQHLEVPRA
ncbi:MAG: LysM peptidoglycan-binding domain-containing protein, partial [Gammaproteobacteria bacterium]|nr:LysM peptidoglycan-binding domain-containing protein [Gammaproteobacteria bacterium]